MLGVHVGWSSSDGSFGPTEVNPAPLGIAIERTYEPQVEPCGRIVDNVGASRVSEKRDRSRVRQDMPQLVRLDHQVRWDIDDPGPERRE